MPPIPSGKQRWRFASGAGAAAEAGLAVVPLPLCCAVVFEGQLGSDSDEGDPTALPVRFDNSEAPASKAGGDVLSPGEDDMNPKALSADRRPLLEKPAPKLVRRGGCESSALVTGCEEFSVAVALLLGEKKNCGRRNELLRCGCDAGCCDWCSGDVRPDDEAIEDEDGDVEYIVVLKLEAKWQRIWLQAWIRSACEDVEWR